MNVRDKNGFIMLFSHLFLKMYLLNKIFYKNFFIFIKYFSLFKSILKMIKSSPSGELSF